MSKLRSHQGISKGKFVNAAMYINIGTRDFLMRLSARAARIYVEKVMALAHDMLINAETAQTMNPTDPTRYELRKKHLLEARGACSALDIELELMYQHLMKNPMGAFDDLKKKAEAVGKLDDADRRRKQIAKEAIERLDHMSENLGALIDDELAMITTLLESDRDAYKKAMKRLNRQ